jgi:glutamate synthase (NADPH/NADH) small chain
MVAEGVELRTGVNVGLDVTGQDLLREYDAVLLSGGAEAPRDLPVPGRDLDGIHFAMEFLEQQNRRVAGDAASRERAILATGKNVLVLGGGDTGSDCIGTSHRQGAQHVYNFELLERPPEGRPDDAPWPMHPMPSQILRTSTSHEEGGSRDWAVSTTRFTGSDGRVEKLHAVRLRFGPPDPTTGRREMIPVLGSEFTLDVDLVLLALGFVGPVPDGIVKQLGVSLTERGNIATTGFAASVPKVYAAGDMRRGQSLVVWAIAEGRQAAEQIDRDLRSAAR